MTTVIEFKCLLTVPMPTLLVTTVVSQLDRVATTDHVEDVMADVGQPMAVSVALALGWEILLPNNSNSSNSSNSSNTYSNNSNSSKDNSSKDSSSCSSSKDNNSTCNNNSSSNSNNSSSKHLLTASARLQC